ncbi:uncharacterized protein LOC121589493 isoform X2 [Anopheles merus]|uniref:uncharacterized protein LOC121589493 isoform X2 n=1 Tax=Anopheles merus TaxID=30066 RepID=UPI001BE4C0FB|nr:uncharacterized protein LOC121589493 isoform X2 [Anopheles merus]
MKRVHRLFRCFVRFFIIASWLVFKPVQCDQQQVPVHYPNRIVFTNESRPFTIRVTRFICTETPYEVSELLQCKTILRRNSPTYLNLTIHVPKVLNVVYFQNRTYNVAYWLEDKFFPKSVPAGDYRQDVWFRDELNKTLLSYQAYFSVRRRGVWKSLIEW